MEQLLNAQNQKIFVFESWWKYFCGNQNKQPPYPNRDWSKEYFTTTWIIKWTRFHNAQMNQDHTPTPKMKKKTDFLKEHWWRVKIYFTNWLTCINLHQKDYLYFAFQNSKSDQNAINSLWSNLIKDKNAFHVLFYYTSYKIHQELRYWLTF